MCAVARSIPGWVQGIPPSKTGKTMIGEGMPSSVAHSPKGEVHYFAPDPGTFLTYFSAVAAPGIQYVDAVRFPDPTQTDYESLLQTSFNGIPTDYSGTMVGTSDFLSLQGPIYSRPLNLNTLQKLFDEGEACNSYLTARS